MKFVFLLSSFFLLISCQSSVEDKIYFEDFPIQHELLGTAISLKGVLVNPLKMALQDSLLVIYDTGTKKGLVHCFVLKDKKAKYLLNLSPYGDGPDELYTITSIFLSKNHLYMHDVQLQRLVRYKIIDILNNSESLKPELFRTNIGTSIITRVIPLDENDKYFLGELMPANPKRFALFDVMNINQTIFFGDYPSWDNLQSATNDFSYVVKVPGNLFQSKIGFIRSDSAIIAAHPYIPVIELIKIDSNSLLIHREVIGPETEYPPKFTLTKDGWAIPCNECWYNYESVRVSENSFYALYSGKLYRRDSYTGRFIFRFNNNGQPLQKYAIDHEISDFVINETTGIMYAISPFLDDQPLLWFQLPLEEI